MKIIKTKIPDVVMIEPKIWEDSRGYFFESYRDDFINNEIGEIKFIQENESKSSFGALRGLHYQLTPYAQSKLVRVIAGSVLDVAVDIRKNSPTFGQYVIAELSEDNKLQMFIPKGFAHGFVTLSETAIFQYKVDSLYNKESEAGIRFNDHELNIDWQINQNKIILSEKDKNLPRFSDAKIFE